MRWANDWFATMIRARSKKRPPPQAAPWRWLRSLDFLRCALILNVLCGALNAATTPPLPVHGGRHPTQCKLLIIQADTRRRIEAIRTLCPIAWALGHSVSYSAVVTLVLNGTALVRSARQAVRTRPRRSNSGGSGVRLGRRALDSCRDPRQG